MDGRMDGWMDGWMAGWDGVVREVVDGTYMGYLALTYE